MPYLIGTDEAGYGPNLGPLTVTGTLWEVDSPDIELFSALDQAVTDRLVRGHDGSKMFIADSKKVYSGSIRNLENGVLAMVYVMTDQVPTQWRELIELICPPETISHLPDQTWLKDRNRQLPVKSDPDQIRRLGDRFRTTCEAACVQLVELQCVPVFPPQFNTQIEELGNKANLLSRETLRIIRRLMDRSDDDIEVGCDKHGGRSRYASWIQGILTDEFVVIGEEKPETSDYSFRENNRDVFIRFQAKGESFLPTALASMVSKYIREIFMMLWNDFWQLKIPDLKPTKGYPLDARRFKAEIANVQAELGIPDRLIWRNK